MTDYPRDLIGYGRVPPQAKWPGGARIAVQFVINYEEGGERNILHGDATSEAFLSEIPGAEPWPGQRHMNMESIYEYGARAGFWRLWRLFTQARMPVTVFGVAHALARNPEALAAMLEARWEIATHGLKWIDYRHVDADEEARQIARAIAIQTELTGTRPLGFYQGRSSVATLDLGAAEQGFVYLSDAYADDLPYWMKGQHGPQLIVPYTLDANDMRFAPGSGFTEGDQFFTYLKDSFDTLYEEGASQPKMLSVGLHCRLAGRPGRSAAVKRFLEYIAAHEQVYVATRLDIARHWIATNPPPGGYQPSRMPRALFVEVFGGIYEHSPHIAEAAHRAGLSPQHDDAAGLAGAMARAALALSDQQKLALIQAHPDLAGKLATAGPLSQASGDEQASAGLDRLTEDERAAFQALNEAYRQKFAMPFVMAVRGRSKGEIRAAFERRLGHSRAEEQVRALAEIDTIARLRLEAHFAARGG
ncbi:MAG: allantoinase PuuE [Hyphomicrobiales bacterium]|nr:allantoinase PuuE [Hyphomicrobiales bacterium]